LDSPCIRRRLLHRLIYLPPLPCTDRRRVVLPGTRLLTYLPFATSPCYRARYARALLPSATGIHHTLGSPTVPLYRLRACRCMVWTATFCHVYRRLSLTRVPPFTATTAFAPLGPSATLLLLPSRAGYPHRLLTFCACRFTPYYRLVHACCTCCARALYVAVYRTYGCPCRTLYAAVRAFCSERYRRAVACVPCRRCCLAGSAHASLYTNSSPYTPRFHLPILQFDMLRLWFNNTTAHTAHAAHCWFLRCWFTCRHSSPPSSPSTMQRAASPVVALTAAAIGSPTY